MNSRTTILNAIKNALSDLKDRASTPAPELPEIWPATAATPETLAQTFAQNLRSVAGEAVLCADENAAVAEIGRVLQEIADANGGSESFQLGVYPSEFAKNLASKVAETKSNWTLVDAPTDPNADPKTFQTLNASLVSPLLLLADTGSAAVEARLAFERFLCYLVPVCLVVARRSQLREHLPAAWAEIEAKMQNPQQRGEIALVTGPSRTADIEKILVLGVHGPKRFVVFVVED